MVTDLFQDGLTLNGCGATYWVGMDGRMQFLPEKDESKAKAQDRIAPQDDCQIVDIDVSFKKVVFNLCRLSKSHAAVNDTQDRAIFHSYTCQQKQKRALAVYLTLQTP